jgi:hypothetical protein
MPLACIPFLNSVTQAPEGQMKGAHKGLLDYGHAQEPAVASHGLFRREIDARPRLRLLQVDGMDHHVTAAQQLHAVRGSSHSPSARNAPGGGNASDSEPHLRLSIHKMELADETARRHLPHRLNRLPLPRISPLDNVAQAREGKMEGMYKGLVGDRHL